MKSQILLLTLAGTLLLGGCASSQNQAALLSEKCAVEPTASSSKSSCAPSKISVAGTYTATLPCPTCSGIDATLTLLPDGTFKALMSYQGRQSFTDAQKGTYAIFGDRITTTDEYKEKVSYRFDGENLQMLHPDKEYTFKRVK